MNWSSDHGHLMTVTDDKTYYHIDHIPICGSSIAPPDEPMSANDPPDS